jgi:uncharacterized membrane protein YkoI
MRRKTISIIAGGLVVMGASGAGLAYAASIAPGERSERQERNDDRREASVLANARISLAQAVQAAEARTGMKASEAGIDDESDRPYFEVSVGQGRQEQTVLVDTQTGQVAQVAADADEADEDSD